MTKDDQIKDMMVKFATADGHTPFDEMQLKVVCVITLITLAIARGDMVWDAERQVAVKIGAPSSKVMH